MCFNPTCSCRLSAIPRREVVRMQRLVLKVRDFFVYKDMYNPNGRERRELLGAGRPGQDAFLLLTKALEAKARVLGISIRDSPGAAAAVQRWLSSPVGEDSDLGGAWRWHESAAATPAPPAH